MAELDVDYERARRLVEQLLAQPELLPFPAPAPRLVETHISWVLLCGEDVLKLKKPVHMGFIDFSTLARRDRCVHEELRLNRRFAPELYLGVLRISGTPQAPRFDGEGDLLESAVHMRQFDPQGQLDVQIERGLLHEEDVREVAEAIARFQIDAPHSEAADDWGRFEFVMAPIRENFVRVREAAAGWEDAEARGRADPLEARLGTLEARSEAWGAALREQIDARREQGFVREGHGDLHLGNIARTQWGIRAFDCLEFAPTLRWIDVVCDLAFLYMDLVERGRADLAWVLVNAWATRTGDHEGLCLLPFYALYRTMVRVKVAALRRGQLSDPDERARCDEELEAYLALAERFARPRSPSLVLTCGPSGSGKSHHASRLASRAGAVHLRSDVERKRLFGLAPEHRTTAEEGARLYAAEATERTFASLEARAGALLAAGLDVIVDATFLDASLRGRFAGLAALPGVRGALLECSAQPATLRARIEARAAAGEDASDADLAVLEMQLARSDAPGAECAGLERFRIGDDGDEAPELERLVAWLQAGEAP
ncbi:MAG: AAA family ATPase [Pseudomonadales bacterium]|nr:AAA family ATPase [Pseudomonadales bacterium]